MATGSFTPVLRYLRRVSTASGVERTDAELLEQFAGGNDGAFAALVDRHGPMVLGVCRRVLRDAHEAEDAFQATFLLLVQKAGSLRQPERLGPWLHGVAYRTALKAKGRLSRRRRRETQLDELAAAGYADEGIWRDVRPMLDEAISALPSRYRAPIVLCYFEGLTNAQAARRLGCPRGTVATRLARARDRLRARLTRRGAALSVGLVATGLSSAGAAAKVPAPLLEATARAAGAFRAGQVLPAGILSAQALLLTREVLRAMFMDKVRIMVAVSAVLAMVGAGAGLFGHRAFSASPANQTDEVRPVPPAPAEPEVEQYAYRSPNFQVEAPSHRIARLVGEAAERQRRALSVRWLGKEMPVWSKRCRIVVQITKAGAGGATSFQFEAGKVREQQMHLQGTLDGILASQLPHEITHTVLAHSFGGPVPRWADEGAAVLAEDDVQQQRHEKLMRQILIRPERFIPLRRLFPMTDFPPDVMALYAEGYSITRFLVDRKDHPTLLAFVAEGKKGDWEGAVNKFYSFNDLKELERAWTRSLRSGRDDEVVEQPTPVPPGAPAALEAIPPLPRVVLARLEKGKIVLGMDVVQYLPVHKVLELPGKGPQSVTSYERVTARNLLYLEPSHVQVSRIGAKGIEGVEPKALTEYLKDEVPVVLSPTGQTVDALHLRVLKEGTLIFALAGLQPAPAVGSSPVAK